MVARTLSVLVLLLFASAAPVRGQIVVSANESKITLVNGENVVAQNRKPDTVTVIDLNGAAPRILGEINVPASIIGPPQSVAIAPDNSIALVTAATKMDPADPTKTAPDNTVSVIDLKATPIAVIGTVHVGTGASGVAINRAGTLALVANRIEGTVSVLSIRGKAVTVAGKVDLGAPDCSPSSIAFAADGRTAFVTRNNDNQIAVLEVSGSTVTYNKRNIPAGNKPYAIDVSDKGDIAVIGSIGGTPADAVSLIDLTGAAPRLAASAPAGATIESVSLSRDGRFVAATVMAGSNTAATAPNHRDRGLLKVFSINGLTLAPVAEVDTGHWCQGVVWKNDGRMILVQCASDREIRTYGFDGRTLTPGNPIPVNGGPAGIRASAR
jgi:hypothetical protein